MPGERVLHTPAGKCPVKLNDTSIEEVTGWANLVIEHGRQNSLVYLPSALIYFSQQFYSIFTPEYKIVKEHIENVFGFNSNEQVFNFNKKDLESPNKTPEKSIEKIKPSEEAEKINNSVEPAKKRRGRPPKNK